MNKKTITVILVILVILIIGGAFYIENRTRNMNENTANENTINNNNVDENTPSLANTPQSTTGLTIVPTMQDKITGDSSWCGTFQLVWNDMKNDVVKKDIVFTPQEEMATNLNKEEFKASMISDEYYYKKYGLKTLELKAEIEQGIKDKFNQTSDILDQFDWSPSGLNDPNNKEVQRYFFYTMLYRKFEYLQEFSKLEKGKFGDKYNDIQYFGIDASSKKSVRDQIEVLYYNSKDDFAVLINTKTNDEVIFCKGPKGNTFKEIYDNMNNETTKYTGSSSFKDIDEFKAPNLKINELREYDEFAGKLFQTADPDFPVGEIVKAAQTIQFSLDEKGGEIKSEAAIDMKMVNGMMEPQEPRYFNVDNTFAIFLREKGQELPYFAAKVEDITKFQ